MYSAGPHAPRALFSGQVFRRCTSGDPVTASATRAFYPSVRADSKRSNLSRGAAVRRTTAAARYISNLMSSVDLAHPGWSPVSRRATCSYLTASAVTRHLKSLDPKESP